jgi:tol-pal system protein YbgF
VIEAPIGAPGGRPRGAPLDLATLSEPTRDGQGSGPLPPVSSAPLPPPPARTPNATGAYLPTQAPSASAKDEYDLAYGYVLRKDYALAETGFRTFIKKHANDRLVADAYYWIGETLYQRQRFRDAAESFLTVSTKYEKAGKAPDSLLRLGQSLAALSEKEAACATFSEISRRYPRASSTVKQTATSEQKRVRC